MIYPVSNVKVIGQLVMEILHFEDLGDTESVVRNAVVLVRGECPLSMATYLRGIADGHTDTHTHTHTYTEPQYNSFANASRLN